MTAQEYREKLHELIVTCGFNTRYHQVLAQRWKRWDRNIRILVGALAAFGLLFSVPGFECHPWWGLVTAFLSLIAAVALNILPVGDWEKAHGELFRLWVDLRRDVANEKFRASEVGEDEGKAAPKLVDRLCELDQKSHSLDAQEPAPERELLIRCQREEELSVCGPEAGTNFPLASASGSVDELG